MSIFTIILFKVHLTSGSYMVQIVHVTLDNYKPDTHSEEDDERAESRHNWVDEVVRSEGRIGAIVGSDTSPCNIIRARPEIKDPSLLSR